LGLAVVTRAPDSDRAWTIIDLAREPTFAIGSIEVLPSSCEIRLNAGVRRVEPRVMQTLIALWSARGRVVSREELMQRCWGGVVVGDNAIQQAIAAIRRISTAEALPPFAIETLPKLGYRLRLASAPEVSEVARALAQKPSIGVLPFLNLSGDPDQDYFADGVTEEVITALSRFHELMTAPRSSTFVFKAQSLDLPAIARQLGVQYVLAGSIRKAGERIRMTVELTDCDTGKQLWRDSYDRDRTDMFELQDELSRTVAAVVIPALHHDQVERAKRKAPDDLTAYDLYLRALPPMWAGTKEEIPKAIALLRQSLQHDSAHVAALSALAWSLFIAAPLGAASPGTMLPEALQYARKAIDLDPGDAFAQAVYSVALAGVSSDADQAVLHAEEAVRLNPGSAFAWGILGYASNLAGNFARGRECVDFAINLSPSDTILYLWLTFLAATNFALERYDEGVDAARKALQRNPDFGTAHRLLAANLVLAQRNDEAREVTRKRDLVQKTSLAELRAVSLFRPTPIVERYLAAQKACGVSD
jgi:TolB-like protein